jgi:hypothetical protein
MTVIISTRKLNKPPQIVNVHLNLSENGGNSFSGTDCFQLPDLHSSLFMLEEAKSTVCRWSETYFRFT